MLAIPCRDSRGTYLRLCLLFLMQACRASEAIDLNLSLLILQGFKVNLLAAVLAVPDAGLQVVDQSVQREVPTKRGPAAGGGDVGRRLHLDVHLSTRNEDAHNILMHLQQVTEH